jgi:hypothetical protein
MNMKLFRNLILMTKVMWAKMEIWFAGGGGGEFANWLKI